MNRIIRQSLVIIAAAGIVAACADDTTLAPASGTPAQVRGTTVDAAIATLRRVTARYQDLNVAIADGFVLLHPCEERPDEGPVGTVYVHMDRLLDGVIDPESPDALIYEPKKHGRHKLVGVEFAMPYALWNEPTPPQFLGETFQPEDEFGVYALHIWIWRNNPEGLFAESNPHVTCDAD
jgi:hypothetical protein